MPGIEPSEDKLLQGRNFSYSDTQRHRLGPNYQQLPINRPVVTVRNENQDGLDNHAHTKGDLNYEPSLRRPDMTAADTRYKAPESPVGDRVVQKPATRDAKDFVQAGERWRSLAKKDQDHLVSNLTGDFRKIKNRAIVEKMTSHFYKADAEFGRRVAEANDVDLEKVKRMAEKL